MKGDILSYLPEGATVAGAGFTISTQLSINNTNLYSGSLSLSTFFENVFKFKPGRKFWVAITAIAAIVLMLGGVLDHLVSLLTFQGVFLLSWPAILITDAFIIKKGLKIGPRYFEHRQEYLYAWNPVGTIALIVSSVIGSIAAFGYMGETLQGFVAFMAAAIAFVLTIALAIGTKGKYYIKKDATDISDDEYIA